MSVRAGTFRKKTGAASALLLTREEGLGLLRQMKLIREFEEQVRSLGASGQIPGLIHLCAGQEAVAVGVCSALRVSDWIASNHRGHGHCIAKGGRIDLLMAEVMGRRPGYGLGRSGTLHIFDPEHGNMGTNGIVGGGIPLAAGAALTARVRGNDGVAVSFFGDGALNQGLLAEVMNMAAVWKLPTLFVCENNGYGEFTASEDVTAGKIISRGIVFEMPCETVDGMDVLAVRAAADRAIVHARAGKGPTFLVCNTYRYSGHHVTDRQEYKDDAEVRMWKDRDPIDRLARHLLSETIVKPKDIKALDAEVAAELAAAVDFARGAPSPTADDLGSYLYA